MSMKLPYLILGLNQASGRLRGGMINVYRVMTEENPVEINANAYLVKSIGMEKAGWRFISNDGWIGWVGLNGIVNLFEKAMLLDPALPPEKIERRQVRMPGRPNTVKINTTSIFSVKYERDEQGRIIPLLVKRNFWKDEIDEHSAAGQEELLN